VAAVATLVLTEKLGVLPDRIFESMFNDRLVAKGTILAVITDIFECYMRLTKGGVDDLVALLVKAKVADRLLEYFPPGQQTEEAFKEHFEKHGMEKLVRFSILVVPTTQTMLWQLLMRTPASVEVLCAVKSCQKRISIVVYPFGRLRTIHEAIHGPHWKFRVLGRGKRRAGTHVSNA
jgi:hypothetical protein